MSKRYQLPIDNTIGITVENKKHLWHRKKSNLTDRIISSSSDRTIRIWNLKSGECSTLKDHTSSVSCLYLNKLSNILYSGSFDGEIKIWCLITNQCIRTLTSHNQSVNSLFLMPNERDLLSCSINSIRIWNFSTGECLKTHYMNESITCLVLLPYTNNIITATAEHRIKIWDLDLEKCLKSFCLTNHNDLIRCLVPMVDSNEFISSSSINIKIFNLETGVLLRTLKGHTSTVNQVVVVDSLCLISCAADNKIKIWDQIKCHCLKTLVGHLGAVSTLCLLRSKELEFCSGSWDEKIRYWSMRGKCLREFRGHTGRVRCLVRM